MFRKAQKVSQPTEWNMKLRIESLLEDQKKKPEVKHDRTRLRRTNRPPLLLLGMLGLLILKKWQTNSSNFYNLAKKIDIA